MCRTSSHRNGLVRDAIMRVFDYWLTILSWWENVWIRWENILILDGILLLSLLKMMMVSRILELLHRRFLWSVSSQRNDAPLLYLLLLGLLLRLRLVERCRRHELLETKHVLWLDALGDRIEQVRWNHLQRWHCCKRACADYGQPLCVDAVHGLSEFGSIL